MIVALASLSAVSIAAAIWFYFRGRRRPGVSPEALYELLRAVPVLREGLTAGEADRTTGRLVGMLECVAVGITDADGTLLSWDGGANHHYADLADAVSAACQGDRKRVSHDGLDCPVGGSCGMGTAVAVPLLVEGETAAVLIVVARRLDRRLNVMVDVVARFVTIQLELERLDDAKSELRQAEMRALRAQISPHFTYNALNTIAELIRTDPEEAEELLQDFADYTRYSFRTSGSFTTLAEELRNIDRYLIIEAAVHSGRIGVRLKIAPEVLSVVMPFLVVQPLVENAIQHGLAPKSGGGTVTLIAEDAGTEAVISVEDDGVGMDPRLLADLRGSSHVGLSNVNQRMQHTFGRDYALMVETAPGAGTKVTLRLPKFMPGVRPVKEFE
uniref:sensor histidine kinase n=1 Tax=Amycolatopsis pittospori TaxID=2749434 RepID=UPI0038B36E0E